MSRIPPPHFPVKPKKGLSPCWSCYLQPCPCICPFITASPSGQPGLPSGSSCPERNGLCSVPALLIFARLHSPRAAAGPHRYCSCNPGSEEDSSLHLTSHFPPVTKPWILLGNLPFIYLVMFLFFAFHLFSYISRLDPHWCDFTGFLQACSSWSPLHPLCTPVLYPSWMASLFISPLSKQ